MMVAIGVDVDSTFAIFIQNALEAGIEPCCINLRVAVEGAWSFGVPATAPAHLHYATGEITLAPEDAYYCRLIDLSATAISPLGVQRWQGLLRGLRAWLDAVPGRVVNRPSGGMHNSSKPLHEAILREFGLRVPPSITSSDEETLRAFTREGPTISKTVSGVRADTVLVTDTDFIEFNPISGPVHLQRCVRGDDVRIHVIGSYVVAQRAAASGVDYRRSGGLSTMTTFEPPARLRDQLIEATPRLGLSFAGWDFKVDAKGSYWCLEANPMPGYGPYDNQCCGAISSAIRRYLVPS